MVIWGSLAGISPSFQISIGGQCKLLGGMTIAHGKRYIGPFSVANVSKRRLGGFNKVFPAGVRGSQAGPGFQNRVRVVTRFSPHWSVLGSQCKSPFQPSGRSERRCGRVWLSQQGTHGNELLTPLIYSRSHKDG